MKGDPSDPDGKIRQKAEDVLDGLVGLQRGAPRTIKQITDVCFKTTEKQDGGVYTQSLILAAAVMRLAEAAGPLPPVQK